MSDFFMRPGARRLLDLDHLYPDGAPAYSTDFALEPSYGPRSPGMTSQVDDFADHVLSGRQRLSFAAVKRHLDTEAFEGRIDVKRPPHRLFHQWVASEIGRRTR